jgi:MFS family permease
MEDTEKAGAWLRPGGPLARILAAGVIALVVAMGIGRFAYTPILPFMQARFGLSNAAIGALASSNYLGYLGGALFAASGALAEVLGSKNAKVYANGVERRKERL